MGRRRIRERRTSRTRILKRRNKQRERRREEKKNKKAATTTRESRSGPKKKNKGKKKKNNKESSKTHRSRSNSPSKGRAQEEKMLGSLSGIATLRREGDVAVKDEDNHKIVVSEFSVGPLQLEVSKVYGKGKARTIRSAKAITDVMSGTMTLKVK